MKKLFISVILLLFSQFVFSQEKGFYVYGFFNGKDDIKLLTEIQFIKTNAEKVSIVSAANFEFKKFISAQYKNLIEDNKDFNSNNMIVSHISLEEIQPSWDRLSKKKDCVVLTEFKFTVRTTGLQNNLKIE